MSKYEYKEMVLDVRTQISTLTEELSRKYMNRTDEDGEAYHVIEITTALLEMGTLLPTALLLIKGVPKELIIDEALSAAVNVATEVLEKLLDVDIKVETHDKVSAADIVNEALRKASQQEKH